MVATDSPFALALACVEQMTRPSYDVVVIDLTVANAELARGTNQPIESITVQQLDAPANIRFGPGAPSVPLSVAGQTFDICPALTEGVFITNAAGVGSLVLMLNFGGLTSSAG